MTDSTDMGERRARAVAGALCTRPRRLPDTGGVVLPGWFGLTVLGATRAGASAVRTAVGGSALATPVARCVAGTAVGLTASGPVAGAPGRPPVPHTHPHGTAAAPDPGASGAVGPMPLAGPGVQTPLPALPPVGPDAVAVAGSAPTATSGAGPGASSVRGCHPDGARPADLTAIEPAATAGTRPARDAADEPAVSPD